MRRGKTTPVGGVLFAAADVIQLLRFMGDYSKNPYLKNPKGYKSLEHDYIRLKQLMWLLVEKYWDLPDEDKEIFRVREIFYSIGNQYKRLVRVLMMDLCHTLDKDLSSNICEDLYGSLLSMIERITTDGWEGEELVKVYAKTLKTYATRLLQFMDTVLECEIPESFYVFFTEEIKEMEDLYGAMAMRIGK